MPYKNIVFAKLEKRLLDDHRWYMMGEFSQLNYIKFILLAAATYNKITKSHAALKLALKTNKDESAIAESIAEIKANFPKFKETKHFYYFADFQEKTNYIPTKAIPRKSQGLPKEATEKSRVYKEEYIKKSRTEKASPLLKNALDEVYKKGLNIYALLNKLKKESKVGARIPDPVLIEVCNSLTNKSDIKNQWAWFEKTLIEKWRQYNANLNIKESDQIKDEFKKGKVVKLADLLK